MLTCSYIQHTLSSNGLSPKAGKVIRKCDDIKRNKTICLKTETAMTPKPSDGKMYLTTMHEISDLNLNNIVKGAEKC
jgi:hypothetical protein